MPVMSLKMMPKLCVKTLKIVFLNEKRTLIGQFSGPYSFVGPAKI